MTIITTFAGVCTSQSTASAAAADPVRSSVRSHHHPGSGPQVCMWSPPTGVVVPDDRQAGHPLAERIERGTLVGRPTMTGQFRSQRTRHHST